MFSRQKRIAFALLPTLVLLLALAGVEVALRLWNTSLANPVVREETADGVEWFQINRSYLQRYFPADAPLVPEFKSIVFRKQKTSATFRILCLGESSMFGTPYQMNAGIPGIIRKQLRRLFSGRDIEVLNLGASAINSNAIADLAPRFAEFSPDLVLVYTGHNEFYGPDGVGASWLERRCPSLTALKYTLRDLRLVQLFTTLFLRRPPQGEKGNPSNLMHQVSQGAQVSLESDDAQRVFTNFERNMREIIATFQRNGVPVVISDVASNLMFPPFAPEPPAELSGVPAMVEGGKYAEAKTLLHASTVRDADSLHAFGAYWLGRVALGEGDDARARRLLASARDEDLLKFRAPRRINEILARISMETRTPFVSTDSLFTAMSPQGIPGPEYFWEHLHPRARGYYLIADLFLRKIVQQRLLPGTSPGAVNASPIPFDPDSLSICWLDLAYADLSIRNLTGKWPFTHLTVANIALDRYGDDMRQIALDVFGRKVTWDEGCYRTAASFQQKGLFREAITTYEAINEEYPYNFYTHYLLGVALKDGHETERAVTAYEASLRLNPAYPFAHVDLGLLRVNQGRFDEGINHFNSAIQAGGQSLTPALKATALYGLATAFANKGEYPKALQYAEESLKLVPSYDAARNIRGKLFPLTRGRR
jgi:tetratricopeptide (TPR) repeat protein